MIYLAIWLHFIGDFVLQSDSTARAKSKNWLALARHVFIYSLCLLFIGVEYAILNGAAHFIIDAITSRITSGLYKKGEIHWFFVVIGFDQAVHVTLLIYLL